MTDNKVMVYCDLDGVMADFDKGVLNVTGKTVEQQASKNQMWKAINSTDTFFQDLPVMEDAMRMWNYILQYNPVVLTATGHQDPIGVDRQKRNWVRQHLGSDVRVITVEDGAHKAQYATPNAILIDDRLKAITPWRNAQGIGILHVKPTQSILEFKKAIEALTSTEKE